MIINVLTLQDQLLDRADLIIKILISLGFEEAAIREKPSQNLITTPRPGGDNPAGIMIYTNTLRVIGNTRSEYTGNIFTLVMKIRDTGFADALRYITKVIGADDDGYTPIKKPFGGFYNNIQKSGSSEIVLPTYDEAELPSKLLLSKRFLDDNISLLTQEKWGVRYSVNDDAVLIPIWYNGDLVGCKARANGNVDMAHRWWAYMPYSKTQVVYGLDRNYQKIISKDKCIITEGEKGVLQLDSMNIHLGLAVAGHSISRTQARFIKSLRASEIIVSFDQDLPEDEVRYEASKLLIDNGLGKNKVSYIYDKNGLYMPKGSKMSPTDKDIKLFTDLYNNRKVLNGS